jgi:hypothetical protein
MSSLFHKAHVLERQIAPAGIEQAKIGSGRGSDFYKLRQR